MSYIESKKADKKKRILEAATKVFADKGFYNAKISQIAEQANVADGTIYLYFNSKDDLLIQIFEDAMNLVISTQMETLSILESASDRFLKFAENHATYVVENPDLAGLVQLEIRQSNKFMKDYKNNKFSEFLNILADNVLYGKENGEFSEEINRHVIKQAIFGGLDEISTQWLFSPEEKRFDLNKALERFMKIIVKGLQK